VKKLVALVIKLNILYACYESNKKVFRISEKVGKH